MRNTTFTICLVLSTIWLPACGIVNSGLNEDPDSTEAIPVELIRDEPNYGNSSDDSDEAGSNARRPESGASATQSAEATPSTSSDTNLDEVIAALDIISNNIDDPDFIQGLRDELSPRGSGVRTPAPSNQPPLIEPGAGERPLHTSAGQVQHGGQYDTSVGQRDGALQRQTEPNSLAPNQSREPAQDRVARLADERATSMRISDQQTRRLEAERRQELERIRADQMRAFAEQQAQLPSLLGNLDGSGRADFMTGNYPPEIQKLMNRTYDESTPISPYPSEQVSYESDQLRTNAQRDPIQPIDTSTIQPGEWKEHIVETIATLERNRALPQHKIGESERVQNEMTLRFLYLLTGEQEKSLEPIPELGESEQRYWREQFFAISELLASTEVDLNSPFFSSNGRRNSIAAQHQRSALGHLADIAMLQVRNVNFCRSIDGFGSYEGFDSSTFTPGQEVLIYCELENLTARESAGADYQVYESELQASVEIYDSQRRVVKQWDYATVRDVGRNRRLDFYVHFGCEIPSDLPDGDYFLRITVEDLLGGKTATSASPLAFRIR